jgi:hypothetical protein
LAGSYREGQEAEGRVNAENKREAEVTGKKKIQELQEKEWLMRKRHQAERERLAKREENMTRKSEEEQIQKWEGKVDQRAPVHGFGRYLGQLS